MRASPGRRRVVWLLLSAAGAVVGAAWVIEFVYVRGDVAAGCSFNVHATTSKDRERPQQMCILSVRGSRQPNGFMWSEKIVVTATLFAREPTPWGDPGEDSVFVLFPATPLRLNEVTSVDGLQPQSMMGWIVTTTVQPEEVMAAVRAGGTLTRTYPGQTSLLIRAGAGLVLGAAGLFGVVRYVWRSIRDERRRAAWLCVACAYPLVNGKCPECGNGGGA